MECLRHHDNESMKPSTNEMETGDEWSESEPEDTDSTGHPGTWDGKKGKVSLPDLNEKSTANDAWIWHTDVEQYLWDGYSARVVKAEML